MIFLIATFVKGPAIVKQLKDEFGVTIHKKLVDYYRHHPEYQKVINQIRERWGNDLLHVELCNKRRRLEELEKIYEKCVATNQMKNALASLYQIQHEVEKDLQKIESQTNIQFNIYKDMTEAELEEERLKSLERLKILKGELILAENGKE